jgi:hypothetical protein
LHSLTSNTVRVWSHWILVSRPQASRRQSSQFAFSFHYTEVQDLTSGSARSHRNHGSDPSLRWLWQHCELCYPIPVRVHAVPNLPLEMRREIWKHTLPSGPNGVRMVRYFPPPRLSLLSSNVSLMILLCPRTLVTFQTGVPFLNSSPSLHLIEPY